MVKVGIIGCGGIADGKHIPSLIKIPEVQLVAFCDIVEEKALELKEKYSLDVEIYTDYKKMLAGEKMDVVHVLTPNVSHAEISIAAMEADCHVMCEKPMAKTYEEAKAMIEAQKRTGKKLTIAYQNRFREDAIYLKKACERGDLGEIYFAKAHALRRRGVPTWGVFLDEEKQGGGPLIDIGTHSLDLTLWLMDNYKPKSVMGSVYKKLGDNPDCGNEFGPWNKSEFTVEDSAFAYIIMENGATIFLESSWALNVADFNEASATLAGTKAGANIELNKALRINTSDLGKLVMIEPDLDGGGVPFFEGKKLDCGDIEAREWIDAVINDTEPLVKPEQAAVVSQILEAVYKSAKTGKAVEF